MRSAARIFAIAIGIGLVAGALPTWLAARRVPELDVHTQPWVTHAGRLLERHPLGQGFRCTSDGLRRIDVALVALRADPRGSVRLVLRADEPRGVLLREVEVTPGELAAPGALVAFEFEPIEDSAGRAFFFELRPAGEVRPAHYSAWVRYHGHVGHDGAWSDQRYEEARAPGADPSAFTLEGLVRAALPPGVDPVPGDQSKPDDVPDANLRALCFGALFLVPRFGEARLELFEEGASGPPVRTSVLADEDEVQSGFAFFPFEPIAESRWRRYVYRLTLPPGTILVGDEHGPTMKTWHGTEGGDPALLGATAGGERRTDRDLVFRAFTEPQPGRVLATLAARAGWRLPAGALLWLCASALALSACRSRRAREEAGAAEVLPRARPN